MFACFCACLCVCIHKSVCLHTHAGVDGSSREDFAAAAEQLLLVGGLSQLQLHSVVAQLNSFCIALALHCNQSCHLIQEKGKKEKAWQLLLVGGSSQLQLHC